MEAVINISAEALEVAKSSSDKAKWHWIMGKALRMLSSLADLPRDAEAEEHFGHAQRLYASTSDRNGLALASEAVNRPTMRFVPIKSREQQAKPNTLTSASEHASGNFERPEWVEAVAKRVCGWEIAG